MSLSDSHILENIMLTSWCQDGHHDNEYKDEVAL